MIYSDIFKKYSIPEIVHQHQPRIAMVTQIAMVSNSIQQLNENWCTRSQKATGNQLDQTSTQKGICIENLKIQ